MDVKSPMVLTISEYELCVVAKAAIVEAIDKFLFNLTVHSIDSHVNVHKLYA